MITGNSIATFWYSHAAAGKAAECLTGMTEPLAPNSMSDAARAGESPGDTMLEVFGYHQ